MIDINELRAAKARKKMSLREISEQSGVPRRTVEDVFRSKVRSPRLSTVTAISKVLGVEDGVTLSTDEARLLVAYAALKPATQQTILDMIESLAKGKGAL